MQYQHHINENEPKKWPRCSHVEVRGDRVICELDWGHAYRLTEAPTHRPHLDFLNLQNDDGLKGFLRRWGPLFGPWPENNKLECWSYHRKLRAKGELVEAFKSGNASRLKNALLELFAADYEDKRVSPLPELSLLALSACCAAQFREDVTQPPQSWISQLSLPRLRDVAAWVIGLTLSATSTLRAVWRNGKAQIDWQPSVNTLDQVIEWCVWHSMAGRPSLTLCKNCGDAFYPNSGHNRKFCGELCARRWTAREWARKRRHQQKLDTKRGKHAKAKKRDGVY
jgi:hypothetical protein